MGDMYIKQITPEEVVFRMYRFEEKYGISSLKFNKMYESGQYDEIDSKDAAAWNLCCVSYILGGSSLQGFDKISNEIHKMMDDYMEQITRTNDEELKSSSLLFISACI